MIQIQKEWWKSKTFWFNLLMAVLVLFNEYITAGVLGAAGTKILLILTITVNWFLRFWTTQAIGTTAKRINPNAPK